jgi:DNA-binding NarL/FixJ family response regulator
VSLARVLVIVLSNNQEFAMTDNLATPTSVFLVAENRLLREALVRILSKTADITVVGATPLEPSTPSHVATAQPHVVLLDSEISVFESPRLVERIRALLPNTKAVLIAMERDEATFFRALRENVIGYVLKDASALEIIGAIRTVAAGEAAYPPCFSLALIRCAAQQPAAVAIAYVSPSPHGLSRREKQLVEFVRAGLTNKEIATCLNLAEQTVKNHVHRILRKVGAPNRLVMVERCQSTSSALSTAQRSGTYIHRST